MIPWQFLAAWSFGYIHPDEHVQGMDMGIHSYWHSRVPWEFSENSVRSISLVHLYYGLPAALAAFFESPLLYFFLVRLFWLLLVVLMCRLIRSHNPDGARAYYTSYLACCLSTRSLSNGIETFLLICCLKLLPYKSYKSRLLLGCLAGLGLSTRPTFPAFLVLPALSHLRSFLSFTTVSALLGFTLVLSLVVLLDSLHVGYLNFSLLNNLQYNTNTHNLSLHGLHPFYTHLFVNIPTLLGPGLALIDIKNFKKHWTFLSSAISGIFLLSFIPHQETRFMIPAATALCATFDISSTKIRRWLYYCWIAFNAIAGLVYCFHQGGIIPAQLYLARDPPTSMIWWKTYSAPMWPLGPVPGSINALQPKESTLLVKEQPVHFHSSEYFLASEEKELGSPARYIFDMYGSSVGSVINAIDDTLPIGSVVLIAPRSADISTIPYNLTVIWSTVFHLNLDGLIDSVLPPGLAIYRIDPYINVSG
ncbi:glycosyltransferase family 22 protein [Tortispora caseinolytica NRRL Y-17796]|uniref:Mannosyltransferase n=1 Tax=Tortispora caseinolytica NRRL Y-17796 TaxID=767744 RepID=A0A1E4TKF7_9ASCO|nr:glycosyltransferase family 22 protein [Tortispora caseinolytica NRRL Y-17796]